MILNYEFGGNDYEPGDDFEYEVDYDEVVEAISYYMADSYIHHIVHTNKNLPPDKVKDLIKGKKVLAKALAYVFKNFDLVTDEVEDDMMDIIKEYYQEEAYEAYKN